MKKFKRLNRNDRRLKSEILGQYLHGKCCILAVAFHREFDEQIVFLMNGEKFVHACTRTPDGRFRDARGVLTQDMVAGDAFDLPLPPGMKEVTEEEVFSFTDNPSSRFGEMEVQEAVRRARMVWVEWKWKDSFLERGHAFIADLEMISKKHGIYLHGQVPAALPVLSPLGPDDALKYVIHEALIGEHFFLGTKSN